VTSRNDDGGHHEAPPSPVEARARALEALLVASPAAADPRPAGAACFVAAGVLPWDPHGPII
jgi:hypothetical protein